ncbi:MAG: glycosyltransferase family 39 protein [Anaerolineae bacterium]|nr:glycosyltransferase family 39 protein [Anaerolineae bacterium]
MAENINPQSSSPNTRGFFDRSPVTLPVLLVVIFILGLGIRLLDLTDAPLDFNPTRQLRAAVIARGLYYQWSPNADPDLRQQAASLWNTIGDIEPSILEGLVAFTYRLVGAEHLWIARIYTSLFWVLGGGALFALARRMFSVDGALVALAFYLFLPFGILASRSFQPDPVMVMWVIFTAYALHRWVNSRDWKWAIFTGVAAGMAALIKVVAAFLIAGMLIAVLLTKLGLRRSLKNRQVWAMGFIMVLPAFLYYVFGLGDYSSDYFTNWVIALSPMLLDSAFYIRWLIRLDSLIPLSVLLLSLVGLVISSSNAKPYLLGLWLGYGLYGLSLPHQTITHDYYHIQLIPIVALSLAPVAELLLAAARRQPQLWQAAFFALALLAVAYPLWTTRSILLGKDYRADAAYWQQVGGAIPRNGKIIALTQQYGHLLTYYGWKKVNLWPNTAEQKLAELRGAAEKEAQDYFDERVAGQDYFLVTAFKQLNEQPNLSEILYSQYAVYAEGSGYILFDLNAPINNP